ncbi:MAG TPA: sugar phosphate nucleotidyltransferase [Nitrospirota bacterium]|nr:sugar phosphate nucleotidyltransferase [Nitrospirota bacterium]
MKILKDNFFIHEYESITTALKKLEKISDKVILVVDESNKLKGTLTDGDVRRFILKGESLDTDISRLYQKNPIYLIKGDFNLEQAKSLFLKYKIQLIPLVDSSLKVLDFITWNQVCLGLEPISISEMDVNIPVVIMAGGKGTRLDPFTKILPKPLMPIGEKTITEKIIDEFKRHGLKIFYTIINYKGEMIESYFNSIEKDYEIHHLWEKDFYGTAGGLKLLEEIVGDIFIVSNCDVIVKANYWEIINAHKKNNAMLTMLSCIQHYKIPYGVINSEINGLVTKITEKPEYSFIVNTGIYICSKNILKYIPADQYFDMNNLIQQLIINKEIIMTYPITENDYIDIGQWDEYKSALKKMDIH